MSNAHSRAHPERRLALVALVALAAVAAVLTATAGAPASDLQSRLDQKQAQL